MTSSEAETLKELLTRLACKEFRGQQQPPFGGNAEGAFFYVSHEGKRYVLKKFLKVDSFERELAAWESLRHTGNVYDLVFSSRDLDGYGGESTGGPYFVVKYEYQKLLKQERNPIKLLERAAQEVDISEKFLRQGWRDLDGNIENDAVNEGKVIRIDLDSAHPLWANARKTGPGYHTPRDVRAFRAVERQQIILNEEGEELSSLAIRFTRLFLDASFSNELNKVLSLKEESRRARLKTWILSRLSLKSRWKRKIIDEWLEPWTRLTRGNSSGRKLAPEEARFLALLFFELLSTSDHGFTLRDLYTSLMLLNLAVLQSRHEMFKDRPDDLKELGALLLELHEPEHFIEQHAIVDEGDGDTVVPAPPAVTYELKYEVDGKDWSGVRKGTDRVGEDVVLLPPNENLQVVVLADGASTAGGSEAVKAVRAVYSDWVKGANLKNLEACKRSIERFVCDLLQELQKSRFRCETTLVIMALVADPVAPSAVFLRFGNSSYVVTRENISAHPVREGAGEFRPILQSSSKPLTQMLGAAGFTPDPSREMVPIPLEEGYAYRLRAFSDGVEREARDLITSKFDIKGLISQASQWRKTIESIGHDDWSVAGFDVVVSRKNISAPAIEEQDAAASSESPAFLDRLCHVEPEKFNLSNSAASFWRRTLRDHSLGMLSEYPLVKKVIKLPHDEIDVMHGNRSRRNAEAPNMLLWKINTTLIVVALIIGVAAYMVARRGVGAWPGAGPDAPTPMPTVAGPRSRQFPRGLSPTALKIYQKLDAREPFVLPGIPRGMGADSDIFDTFISALAEVLSVTDWSVIIQVHTDSSGNGRTSEARAKVNLNASTERGDKIMDKLRKFNPDAVRDGRVKSEAWGDKDLKILNDTTEGLRAENRRLVVIRISP